MPGVQPALLAMAVKGSLRLCSLLTFSSYSTVCLIFILSETWVACSEFQSLRLLLSLPQIGASACTLNKPHALPATNANITENLARNQSFSPLPLKCSREPTNCNDQSRGNSRRAAILIVTTWPADAQFPGISVIVDPASSVVWKVEIFGQGP